MKMDKIKFTNGTLKKIDAALYSLVLWNGGTMVYTATLPLLDAAEIVDKYNTIKLIGNEN